MSNQPLPTSAATTCSLCGKVSGEPRVFVLAVRRGGDVERLLGTVAVTICGFCVAKKRMRRFAAWRVAGLAVGLLVIGLTAWLARQAGLVWVGAVVAFGALMVGSVRSINREAKRLEEVGAGELALSGWSATGLVPAQAILTGAEHGMVVGRDFVFTEAGVAASDIGVIRPSVLAGAGASGSPLGAEIGGQLAAGQTLPPSGGADVKAGAVGQAAWRTLTLMLVGTFFLVAVIAGIANLQHALTALVYTAEYENGVFLDDMPEFNGQMQAYHATVVGLFLAAAVAGLAGVVLALLNRRIGPWLGLAAVVVAQVARILVVQLWPYGADEVSRSGLDVTVVWRHLVSTHFANSGDITYSFTANTIGEVIMLLVPALILLSTLPGMRRARP